MNKSDKDMFLAAGEKAGVMKMSAFSRAMAEAMEYLAIKDALDSGIHKQYEMTAKEFCKAKGVSYETYQRRCNEIAALGKDLWAVTRALGFGFMHIQELASLPEGDKAKIKLQGEAVVVGDQKIPLSNPAEIREALQSINRTIELAAKEKTVLEKELKHQQKKEVELEQKNRELTKELSALKPPAAAEDRKARFVEQLDIVYNKLADCSGLLNHTMDFSLALQDREMAVKYRAVCKAVIAIAHNLEDKIGEVD